MSFADKVGAAAGIGLTDEQCETYAEAKAEVAISLAGRARRLWELSTGQTAVAGEPPCTEWNPQGTLGIDHSGPPWGVAFRHPIAVFGGSSDPAHIVQVPSGTGWSMKWSFTSFPGERVRARIWVKPHPKVADTPYSKLAIAYILKNTGGTSGTVTFKINVLPLGYLSDFPEISETTGSIASGAESIGELTTLIYANAGWNNVDIKMEASYGDTFDCYGLGVNQIKRFSH